MNRLYMNRFYNYHCNGEWMNKNIIIATCFILIFSISKLYSQSETKVVTDSLRVIRIGYAADMLSHVDSRDARVAIELWTSQLVGDVGLNMKTNAHSFPGVVSLVVAINDKHVDLVMLSGLDFLRIKYLVALEPFLVGVTEYGLTKQYVLLSHKDVQSDDLTLFKNKKIVIHSYGKSDDLPRLWLETLLLKKEIASPGDFFKEIAEVPIASRAILSVFFKQSDLCLVAQNAFQTACELNPQLANDLKILDQSPGFLESVVCFRADYDEKMKQLIRERSVLIQSYPKGEQILTLFQLKRMIHYEDSFVNSLETLLKEHDALQDKLNTKSKSIQ